MRLKEAELKCEHNTEVLWGKTSWKVVDEEISSNVC